MQSLWLIDKAYAKVNETKIIALIKDQVTNPIALKEARLSHMSGHALRTYNLPVRSAAAAGGGFHLYQVCPYTSIDRLPDDSIVVVDIVGPIMKYGSWYSWGSVELMDLLIRLGNSTRVAGILLNVDSPGGQVIGTSDLAQTIRNVSRLKPVMAICQDGLMASAAYWLAAAAREVYVTQPTCMIGSIGVYQTLVDFTGYYEQLGIKVVDIYAPQSTDKNQDVIKALEGDESLIKAQEKLVCDFFINTVKSFRSGKIKIAGENEPFTGKLYFGQEATKMGLIEGIKPFEFVAKRIDQLTSLAA